MKRRNRLRRTALLLALLVLAAIVTGVAASATKTVVPKQMAWRWNVSIPNQGSGAALKMLVSRRGRVEIDRLCSAYGPPTCTPYVDYAEFSHVTTHRLSISGIPSCSGTGRYRWTIMLGYIGMGGRAYTFRFTKIHDACQARVNLFAHNDWWRY